jgi:eukaryotic-like serine/threonine-protein kinase
MNRVPGTVLADRYRLTEVLATGGMGEVWRAHDETLDRDVAVKVLRPDGGHDPHFAERFRAEARLSAALSHPNIATVHDFGEEDGTAFLVMELLDGEPLSDIIHRRAPMPQDEVTAILRQAGLALQAAHAAGIVHRDVKPANIVVDPDGYAKLTDFGIARALGEASMTQTGEVLGTPHYLAPEQAQGRPAGPLSDVYALAVVGYEMITGRRPFAGDSMVTTALAHVSQPAPQLSDEVGEPLRTTVMAALAKDPRQRPGSAAAFVEALELAPDELPEELRAAAASAVSPVLSGVPVGLPADAALPTSVIVTDPAAAQSGAPGGLPGLREEVVTEVRARPQRPAWLVPVLVVLAVLLAAVLVVALATDTPAAEPRGGAPGATTGATTGTTSAAARAVGDPPAVVGATSTRVPAPPKGPPGHGKGRGRDGDQGKGGGKP